MAFSSAFKSFWHAMTSNDRHSNYDSPYRSGRHVPLNQDSSRMSALASVASAGESRPDVSSPYFSDEYGQSVTGLNHLASPRPPSITGSQQPYSPGARSDSARRQSQMNDGFEVQSPVGEIPMQSFQDGLPPPPPVSHSWKRIDKWADENYPELYDQICEGCTSNDLNELEHMLDCSLPMDVRESLQIHDGQERGGTPTGIIFSSMLLDCEEIVQEWENWRKVNQEYLDKESATALAAAAAAAASAAAAAAAQTLNGDTGDAGVGSSAGSAHGSDEASSSKAASQPAGNPMWREQLLERQNCIPANSVQKAYAHPAWIPLVRDWGGNNLAVDLAPGPTGQWGQVILFGRDYDTKYVVARSWGAFLALVSDDLNSGKWYIDEDSNELKLREFKSTRVEPSYFDILRWRTDQKYGRRGPKRRSVVPSGASSPTGSASPYVSPTEPAVEPRGRPLQRLSLNSPLSSPSRPGYSKPSPLARVTEESPLTELETAGKASAAAANGKGKENLLEVETPRVSNEENKAPNKGAPAGKAAAASTDGKAGAPKAAANNSAKKTTLVDEADEAMKTIEI